MYKLKTIETKDGNNILREQSSEIKNIAELKQYKKFINQLEKEFYKNPKTVGIAAPQMGVNKKIIFVKLITKFENGNIVQWKNHLMINPEIINQSKETNSFKEGCLSVPGIEKDIKRSNEIKISYLDEKMKKQILNLSGLNARIVLHEIDHLNGVLFIDYND